MKTYENQILDFYSDPMKVVVSAIVKEAMAKEAADSPSAVTTESMPERLKSFKMMTKDDLDLLSDADFAMVVVTADHKKIRRFPIVDAAHVWLSVKYFEKTKDKMSEPLRVRVANRLQEAMNLYHQYSSDVSEAADPKASHGIYMEKAFPEEKAPEKYPGKYSYSDEPREKVGAVYHETMNDKQHLEYYQIKEAQAKLSDLPDEDFAVVVKQAGKTVERAIPISTPELIKEATLQFNMNEHLMTPAQRYEYAKAVLTKAARLNITIPANEGIRKYYSGTYNDKVKMAMQMRRDMLTTADDEPKLKVLDALMTKSASITPEDFARNLAQFDRISGLDRYWGAPFMPDPYVSTFGLEKKASVGEYDIEEDDLAALASNAGLLQSYFSDEMIRAFEEAPLEFFMALPKPNQKLIVGIIKGEM